MSLLAYNLTTAPLLLAAGAPSVTLPPSASAGSRGPAFNVTGELKGLLSPPFVLLQAQVALGKVQYEWSALPEFNTFSLVVGSAQTDVSDLDVEIYVDPVGGNDANPGTPLAPVKTFPRAWDLMSMGRKKRRIYLAAGSYDVPGGVYAVPPSLGSTGEPVVIIGDNTTIETGTILTVIPAGAGRLLVRTVPVAPEFAIGAALTFTNNAAQGCRVTVAHDDGTTITLVAPPTITPADGDTYTIERPASILNLQFAVANFQGGDFAMKNIKVTSPGFGVFRPSEGGSLVAVENVEFDTDNIFVSVFNAHLRTTGFDILFLSPNPFSDALRPTCGVFAHGSNFNFFAFEGAAIGQPDSGALVLKDCQLIINSGSQLLAINPPPCGLRSQIRVVENSYIKTAGDPSVPGIFEAMLFPGFPAFDLRNSRGDLQSLEVNNVIANGAIRVDLQSIVRVDSLTGAGSVAAGIKIRGNSQVLSGTTTPGVPGGASTCTLTGAFDLAIGLLTSTYAALTVDGGISEVNAGGPTFNRFGIQP